MNLVKKHYHWIIAAVALLQMLVYGGAVNNFTSYHVVPVTEALGISRTAFSLAGSFRGVVAVFSTLMTGELLRRFGYRKTAAIGLAAAAAAYVLLSAMHAYWMLALGCGLIGLANGICATSGVSRLINLWFHRYRGTVLGLVTAATGFGSTLLGIAQAYAIDHVSWRLSFVTVAGLLLLTAILVYLFVRNTPEDMSLRPLGWGDQVKEKKKISAWVGFPMEALKKKPVYYLLAGAALVSVLCVVGTQYNFVPYFQDCGMSATRASRLYGAMMLVLGGVKLGAGVLCDLIGAKRVTVICHVACVAGLGMVVLLPQTDLAMIASLIVYDMGIPLTTMIYPLLSVELFGYRGQNQFVGVIMAMVSASSIIAGPIANAVRDLTGSYVPVFFGAMAVAAAMIPIYLLIYGMVRRDRRKLEADRKTVDS